MIIRCLDSWCTIHPSSISSSGFQYLAVFVMVDVRRNSKSHDTLLLTSSHYDPVLVFSAQTQLNSV